MLCHGRLIDCDASTLINITEKSKVSFDDEIEQDLFDNSSYIQKEFQ